MTFYPLYPIHPFALNQGWGTLDPKDYSQFGFTRHNGIDVRIEGTDMAIRAPFSGTIVRTGNQPNGGGVFIGLLSDDTFEFPAFTCSTPDGVTIEFPAASCRVLFDFLHLQSFTVQEGQHVNAKDILATPDNTGFSTGPHCHIQPRREFLQPAPPNTPASYRYLNGEILIDVDKNDANNSFDPTHFWSGIFADTAALVAATANKAADVANAINSSTAPAAQKLTWLQSIFSALKSLFQRSSNP